MKTIVGVVLFAVLAFAGYLAMERPEILERFGSAAVGKADEMSRKVQDPVVMVENTIGKLENYIRTVHVDIAEAKVSKKHNARQLEMKKRAYMKELEQYKGQDIPAEKAQSLALKKRSIELKAQLNEKLTARIAKWERNEAKAKERLVQQYASLDALKAYMKDIAQTEQLTEMSVDDLRKITHGDVVDFDSIMNEMEVKAAGAEADLEASEGMVEVLQNETASSAGTMSYEDLAL